MSIFYAFIITVLFWMWTVAIFIFGYWTGNGRLLRRRRRFNGL